MKGRLLPFIYEFASTELNAMLVEAQSWTVGHYNGDLAMWQECVGACLFTVDLAVKSIAEYDQIPLLFARLDQPGIRDRCVAQFHEVPMALHNRVSLRVLAPGSSFIEAIMKMSPDGTGMEQHLRDEVNN